MYNHEFIATLNDGDIYSLKFDYENGDFEHVVYWLANTENVNNFWIKWDKKIFSNDYETGFRFVKDTEEMNSCLIILLDCIHEQLKGVEKLIDSQKGVFNHFVKRWLSFKENLEMMEQTVFLEYCETIH